MKFKKSISLALVMCMVLSLFASFVVSAEEAAEVTNIAAGKDYTISDQFRMGGKEVNWGWDANAPVCYPDEGGTLTDGVSDPGDSDYLNVVWAGFNHNTPSYKDAEYPNHKITVDLGAVTEIQGAAIYLATSTLDNGIDYTYSFVSVNVSDDGETWTTLDSVEIGDDVVTDANYAKVSFDKAGTGRYVEFRLAREGWLFVSEVEVYGISSAEEEPETPALSAEVVLPEGTGITVPTGYGAIDVIVDGDNGLGVIDGYENFKAQLYTLRNGTTDVESTYSIKLTLEEAAWFDAVTVNMLNYTSGNVGLPKAITVVVGDNSYDAVVAGDDKAIANIVVELGEAVKASEFTINVTMNSGEVKYNMYSEIEVALVEVEEPVEKTPEEIVDEMFALEGEETLENVTLTGVISSIYQAYSEQYGNISVYITVNGTDGEKNVCCFRAKGEGIADLAVGDTITVTGNVVLYNGNPQFAQGCVITDIVKGEVVVAPEDPKQIVDEAFALEADKSLAYVATLTGVVVEIDTAYSEQYKNVSVVILVEGSEGVKELLCYRLVGDDAATVKVGDTITVTGYIKNYRGTIEFDAKSTIDECVAGELPALVEGDNAVKVPAAGYAVYGTNFESEMALTISGCWDVTVVVDGTEYWPNRMGNLEAIIPAGAGYVIFKTASEADVEVYVTVAVPVHGDSIDDPLVLEELGELSAAIDAKYPQGAYYKYVATVDGTITLTVKSESGWQYNINNLTTGIYGDTHWFDDETVVTSETIEVSVGDEITFWVSTYDPENMWSLPEATVEFTVVEEAAKIILPEDDSVAHITDGYGTIDVITDGYTGVGEITGYEGNQKYVLAFMNNGAAATTYSVVANFDATDINVVKVYMLDYANGCVVLPEAVTVTVNGKTYDAVINTNPNGIAVIVAELGETVNASEVTVNVTMTAQQYFFNMISEVETAYIQPPVTGNFAEEGLNGVNQFAVNAHNIWVGDASSIEWWTKALLQWNEEANGWEVLKVQGNGKVDWVTEGNQIVIAAHADNGAAVASIASLQVGDIVYIWDIGVATSDKLGADVDCNGGFYTTDASKTGTTAFTYKEKVALAGDVNMDGEINEADYIIIRKLVVGTADAADYTAEQLKLADVNGNGVIDANDYLVVKRHALGTYVIPAWR